MLTRLVQKWCEVSMARSFECPKRDESRIEAREFLKKR